MRVLFSFFRLLLVSTNTCANTALQKTLGETKRSESTSDAASRIAPAREQRVAARRGGERGLGLEALEELWRSRRRAPRKRSAPVFAPQPAVAAAERHAAAESNGAFQRRGGGGDRRYHGSEHYELPSRRTLQRWRDQRARAPPRLVRRRTVVVATGGRRPHIFVVIFGARRKFSWGIDPFMHDRPPFIYRLPQDISRTRQEIMRPLAKLICCKFQKLEVRCIFIHLSWYLDLEFSIQVLPGW